MMIRVISILVLLFSTGLAHAGDVPLPPVPAPHPHPHPVPAPAVGFCDGVYQGYLLNQPGALTLEVRQLDSFGNIAVTGWWGGAVWNGTGICHQVNHCQAVVNFQFPFTPVQRGMVTVDPSGAAVMEGRVDGGDAFRVMRRSW